MDLLALHSKIRSCQLCPLWENRYLAVPGEGPSPSSIMLVGEAPGAQEDQTGRPFVGRAGRLLTLALTEAGIDRTDVFITSVIKCRPPKNRKPKMGEIEACLPYLGAQMELVKPRAVALMGNVATKAVLGIDGVTVRHGQLHRGRFVVTFHPAAVLRNKNLMKVFVGDLKRLKDL
jgi:uracil-DNA glycosylase family 4